MFGEKSGRWALGDGRWALQIVVHFLGAGRSNGACRRSKINISSAGSTGTGYTLISNNVYPGQGKR